MRQDKPKPTIYERVTEQIIEQLEQGTVPWQKPWDAYVGAPRNGASGRYYRGMNVFLLALAGQGSPWWFTPRQVNELGGHIRKGERVSWVHFFKPWTPKQAKGAEAVEVDETGRRPFLIVRAYRVVNLDQCEGEGVDAFREKHRTELPERHDHEPIAVCESLILGMPQRPGIRYGGPRAFYRPWTDTVFMPERDTFTTPEGFYSVLFHELTHSTGHADRLNRKTVTDAQPFGSPSYSREELVAEMGAAFLCATAGIQDPTLTNSAAYIQGWLKVLKSDPKALVIAGAQAQKAADFILGYAGIEQAETTTEAVAAA